MSAKKGATSPIGLFCPSWMERSQPALYTPVTRGASRCLCFKTGGHKHLSAKPPYKTTIVHNQHLSYYPRHSKLLKCFFSAIVHWLSPEVHSLFLLSFQHNHLSSTALTFRRNPVGTQGV